MSAAVVVHHNPRENECASFYEDEQPLASLNQGTHEGIELHDQTLFVQDGRQNKVDEANC